MPRGKRPGLRGELAADLLAPGAFPSSHCWARAEGSCVSLGVPGACGCTDLPLRPWVVLAFMMTPKRVAPLSLTIRIFYFLAQRMNSYDINTESDMGGRPLLQGPQNCCELEAWMLTLGNHAFHRHFRPKSACSMGYAGGGGRARLALGVLGLQALCPG